MPSDTTPRSFAFSIARAVRAARCPAAPPPPSGPPRRSARRTRSSRGAPSPTSTRQTESRSAFGCGSRARARGRRAIAERSGPMRSTITSSKPPPARGARRARASARQIDELGEPARAAASSDLLQHAQVALEQVAQVRDAEAAHRGAVDAHAEREALIALGVDAAALEHARDGSSRSRPTRPSRCPSTPCSPRRRRARTSSRARPTAR